MEKAEKNEPVFSRIAPESMWNLTNESLKSELNRKLVNFTDLFNGCLKKKDNSKEGFFKI